MASTNARSLALKINSVFDAFSELDLTCMIATETWLKDGRSLEDNVSDLELGSGLGLVHRGRKGKCGGGVGILYKKHRIHLKKLMLRGSGDYEMVAASGKLQNN